MITTIAIDDEPNAIEVVEYHASKIENIDLIACFHNPKEAITFLKQNPVDLILLDINMPNMSGLELLEELKLTPMVIFTTAYTEFAIESYSYNAIDYLLKPFEFDRFQIAIHKVEARMEEKQHKNTFFFIKDGFKSIKIQFDEILYVKGSGNYLDITTKEKVYSPRMTFVALIDKVSSLDFVRVHQSYLININNIDKVENNHVHIHSHKIPISNRYKELFFKKINLES